MSYLLPDKGPYPDEYAKPPHERDVIKLSKQDAYVERKREEVIEAAKQCYAVGGPTDRMMLAVEALLYAERGE